MRRRIEMKGYYSIGELSKLSGLSHDTLRYYDSIGLLKADYVDESSRYRYYKLNAFWKTDVIKMFKMLNMPLEELKDVLPNRGNLDVLADSLNREKKGKQRQQLQRLKTMVKDIEWFEDMLEEMRDMKESEVSLVHKKEKTVIYADNNRKASEYHLTLLDICQEEVSYTDSVQRKYGYFLKQESLQENHFLPEGEYMDLYKKKYLHTDPTEFKSDSGRGLCNADFKHPGKSTESERYSGIYGEKKVDAGYGDGRRGGITVRLF